GYLGYRFRNDTGGPEGAIGGSAAREAGSLAGGTPGWRVMTLGRVTQLPASRGQAGYRAQAMFTFSAPVRMRSPCRRSCPDAWESNPPRCGPVSGATAVTASLIACRCTPHGGCND